MGFRVWGSGFRCLGFRVWGGVKDVWDSGVTGLGFGLASSSENFRNKPSNLNIMRPKTKTLSLKNLEVGLGFRV